MTITTGNMLMALVIAGGNNDTNSSYQAMKIIEGM